jgi:molybdenum cofactor cytidylyltransferase
VIFGEFPLVECEGLLLAHSLRLPDRIMKKGRRLTSADSRLLAAAGIEKVHGARLDAGRRRRKHRGRDGCRGADRPGHRSAHAACRPLQPLRHGRGLVTVDAATIGRINRIDEAVTVATLPPLSAVRKGAVVATVKIIPLAVGRVCVDACATAAGQDVALGLLSFRPQRAALVVTEQPGEPSRNYIAAVTSSRRRMEELGSHLGLVQRCAHDAPAWRRRCGKHWRPAVR